MFGLVRQFARLLTGKVQPFEIGLGAFFGVLLALIPSRAVDEGTGFAGFSTLWLLALFCFLALRASIPVALALMGLFEILERLFLGRLTSGIGRSLLEDVLPQSAGIGFARAWPSAQLHTWWGLGGALCGILLGLALAIPANILIKRKLPYLQEKFGKNRITGAVSHNLFGRVIGFWLG